MRHYNENYEIRQAFCNQCGKSLRVENGVIKEGCFHVDYVWGYFSTLDGQKHNFDLCEECYQKLVQNFALPVTEGEATEFL